VADGCGGNISCGPNCTAPNTCGGGGTANVCGCRTAYTCCAAIGFPNDLDACAAQCCSGQITSYNFPDCPLFCSPANFGAPCVSDTDCALSGIGGVCRDRICCVEAGAIPPSGQDPQTPDCAACCGGTCDAEGLCT
jgi:hypothetical protein